MTNSKSSTRRINTSNKVKDKEKPLDKIPLVEEKSKEKTSTPPPPAPAEKPQEKSPQPKPKIEEETKVTSTTETKLETKTTPAKETKAESVFKGYPVGPLKVILDSFTQLAEKGNKGLNPSALAGEQEMIFRQFDNMLRERNDGAEFIKRLDAFVTAIRLNKSFFLEKGRRNRLRGITFINANKQHLDLYVNWFHMCCKFAAYPEMDSKSMVKVVNYPAIFSSVVGGNDIVSLIEEYLDK